MESINEKSKVEKNSTKQGVKKLVYDQFGRVDTLTKTHHFSHDKVSPGMLVSQFLEVQIYSELIPSKRSKSFKNHQLNSN